MKNFIFIFLLVSSSFALQDDLSLQTYFKNYLNYFNTLRRSSETLHDDYFKIVTPQITSKVLISAPHTLPHLRKGKYKWADSGSGALALTLQRATKTHLIYTTRSGVDPNYYDKSLYKVALKKYLQEHPEIELVIDIHGASPKRSFDVDLGTMHHKSIRNVELYKLIKSHFDQSKLKVSENFFSASKAETITKFAFNLGLNSIQMENNVANLLYPEKKLSLNRLLRAYTNCILHLEEAL
ncbi:MAG: hypothetical protein KC646_13515 [Candidatus Cloacimonetes bacterium]|nr:hypothetical protein [Candidatus Cloacimonadota bacterium]